MSICGAQCHQCSQQNTCQGCRSTGGQPFGKPCFITRYLRLGGPEALDVFKALLMEEINQLAIPGMSKTTDLVPLNSWLVNLAYPLPSGLKSRLSG